MIEAAVEHAHVFLGPGADIYVLDVCVVVKASVNCSP